MTSTFCHGCNYFRFGEIVALLPNGHFSSWKCLKKLILFGDNKEGGQKPFPQTCKEKTV